MERELRIVLIGKTGSGKSATGNSILGEKKFVSKLCSTSVTSKCKENTAERFGRKIVLVDTPGMYDTGLTNEQTMEEVRKCIGIASPGPHAFVLVIRIGRFTEEEQRTVELFKTKFGDGMLNYALVLFTGKDDLDEDNQTGQLTEYVESDPTLTEFIGSCGDRYMAINNKNPAEAEKDVTQMISMINEMVTKNGGLFYTNDILKSVEELVAKRAADIRKDMERKEEERAREEKAKIEAELRVELEQSAAEDRERLMKENQEKLEAIKQKHEQNKKEAEERAREQAREEIQKNESWYHSAIMAVPRFLGKLF